ncbi:MAG: ABC transporter substrate-binding protein [Acidimicrobiales bacterium]
MPRTLKLRRATTVRARAALAFGVAASLAVSLCCVVATGAASASARLTKAPGSATSGTITFWANPITTAKPDPRTVLVDDFEKKYPHIHVKIVSAPTNSTTDRATLTTEIAGGAGPDVYSGTVTWPAEFGAHGFAVNLAKYLPKSYFNTFASGLVAGATYKGQVLAAPYYTTMGLLYYRKDLLAKDHLAVPKTWAQLKADAKLMQSKGQVKYGLVFQSADYEGATCDYLEYLTDAGGKVLNASDTKAVLTANSDATKALTTMVSWVKTGISPKAESTYEEATSMATFREGNAAFLRNWPYAYATSQGKGSAVVGKVGVAPLPTYTAKHYAGYSTVGGWDLFVNPHSKNIAADLTFVKYITGKSAQTDLATKWSQIPTISSVQKSPAVKKVNPVLAIISGTRLVARPSGTPDYAQVSQALYQNVSAAVAGTESVKAAIIKANVTINSDLASSKL